MSEVRWHHRLAAWLYEHVGHFLVDHAMPVWNEEADAEFADWQEAERDRYESELNAAYDAGYEAAMDETG